VDGEETIEASFRTAVALGWCGQLADFEGDRRRNTTSEPDERKKKPAKLENYGVVFLIDTQNDG